MRYPCCVPGCKSNYKKDEPRVTVFKFHSIGELIQKWLHNIPRKFEKITISTRVCIKYFEDKDVNGFNIKTSPDGTSYTVREYLLSYYIVHTCIITNIKSMSNMVSFYL